MKDAHQYATGVCPGIGLGAEADLTGDDRGAQISLSEIVLCRDLSIFCPSVLTILIFAENFLDTSYGQMLGRRMDHVDDLGFNFHGSFIELSIRDEQATQVHRRRQKGSKDADENLNFFITLGIPSPNPAPPGANGHSSTESDKEPCYKRCNGPPPGCPATALCQRPPEAPSVKG